MAELPKFGLGSSAVINDATQCSYGSPEDCARQTDMANDWGAV